MFLWRISSHATLEGRGGLLTPARWHTEGRRIVYLAESAAGALLEALVHLELVSSRLPSAYKLLKIELSDRASIKTVSATELTEDWTANETVTRALGDAWLAVRKTPLLRVPSALVPETYNVLFNPAHPDSAVAKILWHREYPWDKRLLTQTHS